MRPSPALRRRGRPRISLLRFTPGLGAAGGHPPLNGPRPYPLFRVGCLEGEGLSEPGVNSMIYRLEQEFQLISRSFRPSVPLLPSPPLLHPPPTPVRPMRSAMRP